MGIVDSGKWEYFALDAGLLIRCQGRNRIEVLTGNKRDSLEWTPAVAHVDEIARMIPKNATLLNNEEDAKELHLKIISRQKH